MTFTTSSIIHGDEASAGRLFSKAVCARLSPANKCFVAGGELLTVLPRRSVPMRQSVPHHFVALSDLKTTAKYGWVVGIEVASIEQLIAKTIKARDLDQSEVGAFTLMLLSVDSLPLGTPVAATYSSRGVLNRQMELSIHKVFFYPKQE